MQVAVIHTAFEDVPQTVAFVEVGERTGEDALEYAYRWTNNVMGSWSIKEQYLGDEVNGDYNDDVTVMAPLHKDDDGREWGLRSTSVGDQMLMGTTKYRVAGVGFEEI
jgi:hypothetical protein